MAIKIDGQDLLKRYINGQEIVRVYKNGGEIRPNTVPPTPPVFDNYLCFTANTSGSTLSLVKHGTPTTRSLEISYDKSTWNSYSFGTTITLSNQGDKVYFRSTSTTTTTFSRDNGSYYQFSMNGSISASGDITSLVCKTGTTAFTGQNTFYSLFGYCSSLTTAPELPATTLVNGCYENMFELCTSLTTAPSLPATTLGESCYHNMFGNCTSLNTIPNLPATTLPNNCYVDMFFRCSSIKISEQQDSTYTNEYRIPTSGTGTVGTYSLEYMFRQTGGTFTGTPSINTTYYTSNTIV